MGIKWPDIKKLADFFKDKQEIFQKIGPTRIVIIILAGIVLVIASVSDKKDNNSSNESLYSKESGEDNNSLNGEAIALSAMAKYVEREEKKLENILEKVEGLGKVEVMITLASSEERITLKDSQNSENSINEQDGSGGIRQKDEFSSSSENVIISEGGSQTPFIVQINSPKIEGVAVVAQGAGTGEKDSEIIDAVMALFSVEPHKIKVMKME